MSTLSPSDSKSSSGLVNWVISNRKSLILGEFILGGLLVILTLILFVQSETTIPGKDPEKSPNLESPDKKSDSLLDSKKETENTTIIDSDLRYLAIYVGFLAVVLLLHGTLWSTKEEEVGESESYIRMVFVQIGLPIGILTVLFALNLAYRSQTELVRWLTFDDSQQSTDEKDPMLGAKRILLSLFILFAGLGLIFFSCQPARAEERNNPTLRRLVYGSNTILTGLLLLVILIAINLVVGFKLPGTVDTTETKFYSLDEKSKELLASFDEPINAYLVCRTTLPANLYADIESLLKNCERINPKFKAHFLIPGVDADEIRKLFDRLKLSRSDREDESLIVAVGENQDRVSVIRVRGEIFTGDEERNIVFEGEPKLMTELNFLSQKGGKPVVYFTQGNDELELGPGSGGPGPRRTANDLSRYLTDRKFDVQPLRFELGKKPTLAENTAAIVVLGPHKTFPPDAIQFLSEYVKPPKPEQKPGKLILLLPPFKKFDSDKIAETGFEGMLSEYGIDLKPERVVTAPLYDNVPPDVVRVVPGREIAETPLLKVVNRGYFFHGTRLIDVGGPPNPRYSIQRLLLTDPQLVTWIENSYPTDPDYYDKIFERIQKDEKLAKTKIIAQRAAPVAVMIGERTGPPANPMGPPPEATPRILVFGSSGFVTDEFLQDRGRNPDPYLELFTATVDWLRERPASIGIAPRTHKKFTINRQTLDGSRLYLSPMLYMLVSIIGIGVVVWVIRRK